MKDYSIELSHYMNCLYEIKKRMEVISDHINRITTEKYLIVEIETICLQFRKILEKIALLSLVANKEAYAEQHEKFAKHYHAKLILKDLERINPQFYPVPTKRIHNPNGIDRWENITEGYLTKDELEEIYEKCGGMLHAQNPFASQKTGSYLEELKETFPIWLTKIYTLLAHHQIVLCEGDIMLVAMLEREDNGLPQAVIFKSVSPEDAEWDELKIPTNSIMEEKM